MPGLSGLETLNKIKSVRPVVPVIMITKSEEEDIMDKAIGSKIADYLIKPVNPKQILLTIKKNIDHKRLITEKTTTAYQSEFAKITMAINESSSFNDWVEINKKLVYWDLELERLNDNTMEEVLDMQKSEANISFTKFIKKNYYSWFDENNTDKPLLSKDIIKHKVVPLLKEKEKVCMIVVDNLRYDQWKILQPAISEYFELIEEDIFCSILPTATQYSRNAMFAGMMPLEIEKLYPEYWLKDEEEGGKNLFEKNLLEKQIPRLGLDIKFQFEKIMNNREGKKLVNNISNILINDLFIVVYNFVDMLSHARTESQMIRELASDESAYRSLTLSWFEHSTLLEFLKALAEKNVKVVITTDHGTIRVNNPVKVIGDRNTSTNLRYKQGRNLNYNPKDVFE
ncbi:PglZ domain-containing protein, partial [Bacteroidota bacterium]